MNCNAAFRAAVGQVASHTSMRSIADTGVSSSRGATPRLRLLDTLPPAHHPNNLSGQSGGETVVEDADEPPCAGSYAGKECQREQDVGAVGFHGV
jgi:hypothetical protein